MSIQFLAENLKGFKVLPKRIHLHNWLPRILRTFYNSLINPKSGLSWKGIMDVGFGTYNQFSIKFTEILKIFKKSVVTKSTTSLYWDRSISKDFKTKQPQKLQDMRSCYPIVRRSTPISREKQESASRAKCPSDREKSQKTTFLS